MDDLISRQNLIMTLTVTAEETKQMKVEDLKKVINVINNQLSEQQWIPCSERLPDSQEDVLCDDDGRVTIGYYTDEEIGWHDTHSYRIYPTAWMPLPDCYQWNGKGEGD